MIQSTCMKKFSLVLIAFVCLFLIRTDTMSQSSNTLTKEEVQNLKEPGTFKSITKYSDLPSALQKQLGKMADPGKPFNAGCVRTNNLPDLSLCFAAKSGDRLWICYQSGGICLVNRLELYDISDQKNKQLWSTVTPKPVQSMEDLIKAVQKETAKKN